jgi:antitoxin component of RelBE/YafQ-DinJ toxin-antitoxin module
MPRPGPRRPLVNVRLSDDGVAFLDAEAERLGVTRSDVIRLALTAWAKLPEPKRRSPGVSP